MEKAIVHFSAPITSKGSHTTIIDLPITASIKSQITVAINTGGNQIRRAIHARVVLTVTDRHTVLLSIFKDNIDNPCDSIRAILCRRTIPQHLNTLNGRGRNIIQIHRRRATANSPIKI